MGSNPIPSTSFTSLQVFFKKQILMYHDMIEAKRKLDNEFQQFDDKIIKITLIKNSDNINRSVMNIFFYLFNDNQNKS
jgi:hypothetical protein